MNDIVKHEDQVRSAFPDRQQSSSMNVGAVAIEQERAIAEARGQMQLAKMFPRSMSAAQADLMEACRSAEFAGQAFYSVPNRGSGPSIRFAEEVGRVYGNFQYGHRELSRGEGKSEIEVYAWDVEKNNRSTRQITVLHIVDTKNGPKKLTDQADIDNRVANVASKQMRGRILALVPKSLVALGIAECKRTLAGGNDEPMGERITRMISAFARLNVTREHLSTYLGRDLDDITQDEFADMIGVYNAIKEGAKASDYFGTKDDKQKENEKANAAIAGAAKSGKTAAGEPEKTTKKEPEKEASTESAEKKEPAPQSEKAGKAKSSTAGKNATKASESVQDAEPEPEPSNGHEDENGDDDDDADRVF